MKFIVDGFIYIPKTYDIVKGKDIPEHYEIKLKQLAMPIITTIKIPVKDNTLWQPFRNCVNTEKPIEINTQELTEVFHLPLFSLLN